MHIRKTNSTGCDLEKKLALPKRRPGNLLHAEFVISRNQRLHHPWLVTGHVSLITFFKCFYETSAFIERAGASVPPFVLVLRSLGSATRAKSNNCIDHRKLHPRNSKEKPAPPWLGDIAGVVSGGDGSLLTLETVRQKYLSVSLAKR